MERVERRFKPTELGLVVNDLLVENFADFVDLDFTANMEEKLDDIARGEREWVRWDQEVLRSARGAHLQGDGGRAAATAAG